MEEPQIPRVHFIRSVRLVSAYQTGKLKSGLGGWLRVGAMHENAFCISMKISDPMQHWAREEQRLQGLLDTSIAAGPKRHLLQAARQRVIGQDT